MIYNVLQGCVFPEGSSGQVSVNWPGGAGRLVVEGTFSGTSAKVHINATGIVNGNAEEYTLAPGLLYIDRSGQWNFTGPPGYIAFSWGLETGDSVPWINLILQETRRKD